MNGIVGVQSVFWEVKVSQGNEEKGIRNNEYVE